MRGSVCLIVAAIFSVAFAGSAENPEDRYQNDIDTLKEINNQFHSQHRTNRALIASRFGPLIVVEDGEKITLIHRGRRIEKAYTPKLYHLLKEVDHVPLMAFLTVKTYLAERGGERREIAIRDLKAAHDAIKLARERFQGEGLDADQKDRQIQILEKTLDLMNRVVDRGDAFENAELDRFAHSVAAPMNQNAIEAARAQLRGLDRSFREIKLSLSEVDLKTLRVIVMGSAPPRLGNLAVQYFSRALGVNGEGERIVYAESIFDIDRALDKLAAHDVDHTLAKAFLGDERDLDRDLLEKAAREALDQILNK